MEDPITGHHPCRSVVDEEEELQAQEFAESYSTPPVFEWSGKREGLIADGKVQVRLLVLITSTSASSLMTQCLEPEQGIGRIIQPEILQDAPIALRAMVEGPTGKDSACELYIMGGGASVPAVLVAMCRAAVTPERSGAWANGLFAEINPEQVICISSLPARQFIGQEDPTQEPLHFLLQTNGSRSEQKHGIPLLPTGNLVSGQPAAIMSYCQVHGIPATLLVSVDASPLPDSIAVKALAQNMVALLEGTDAKELAAMLKQPSLVLEACRKARQAMRLSDRAALYI
ncbi:probable proteasome assembly chaperone 1 [Coccomyxa sp. Obi]|nr:probable proteasome assembly chaperone 1 [Coccomyxa sp. Obi]